TQSRLAISSRLSSLPSGSQPAFKSEQPGACAFPIRQIQSSWPLNRDTALSRHLDRQLPIREAASTPVRCVHTVTAGPISSSAGEFGPQALPCPERAWLVGKTFRRFAHLNPLPITAAFRYSAKCLNLGKVP